MMIFLSGCGGSSAPMTSTPTGSVSINMAWDGSTTVPSSVVKINVAISSPGASTWTVTLPAASWNGGTLDKVPIGTETVVVTALDAANNTIYQGVVQNQVVKAGQATPVATIAMQQTTPLTYTIAGKVTLSDTGALLPGATAALVQTGSNTVTAQTDANGQFLFTGIPNGSYTMSVSMPGYTMSSSQTVVVSAANISDINFTATHTPPGIYTISGQVTLNGAGLSGVSVVATGSGLADVKTDSNGNFTFTQVSNGSYTVSASMAGYGMSAVPVVVNSADVNNVSFAASVVTAITLGTPLADVLRIQGTPTAVQNYQTYAIYSYGTDTLTISIPGNLVTAWSNTRGTLKVNMAYQPNLTGFSTISLGDSWNDMIRVQGTPTVIQNNGTSAVYYYNNDYFNISTASNMVYTVIGWSNTNGTLNVKMRYGVTTGATKITLGSSSDDMIKIQGTPTVIQNSGTTATYFFGGDSFYLSTPANKVYTVTGWSNANGTLLVTMLAVNPTTASVIAIGSSLDDVINVQKVTPVAIRNYGTYTNYYYGSDYYSISVPDNKVIGWYNAKGALLVDMSLFTIHTAATTFGFNASLNDVISVEGTPAKIINNVTYATYYYKADSVDISIPANKVLAWSNSGGTLKLLVNPGSAPQVDSLIKIGTSWSDLVRIQGTPTVLKNYGTSFILYYGLDSVNLTVSVPENTVTGWNNVDGKLKLQ